MRHPLRFAAPLLLALPLTLAQAAPPDPAPTFAWASAAGGAKNDKTRGVALDRAGNLFLTGEITDEAKFGEITVKSQGGLDFFLAKLDPQGHFLWARLGGGSLIDRGYGVAADAEGNSYVTGHYQSTDAVFSGVTLTNRGGYDVFVAKYDPSGKMLWIQTAGGAGYDYGHSIAVDSHGDVVVTGAVVGDSEFGEVKVPNEPGSHIFCAKYHADGKLAWVKVSNGKAWGGGQGLTVDGAANIYIAGNSSGAGKFGEQPLDTPKGSSAILAKLSPAGEVLWVRQYAGQPSALFHATACDNAGRVWASGMIKGTATFGSETFATTGEKDSDAVLCRFDSDGKLLWTRVGQGPEIDYGLGVATDGRGNAFLTGEFNADFKLGGAELHSRGSADIYVAKFDESGTLRWLTQAGGDKSDNAYTMVCDPAGNLYFGGSFAGTAKFDEVTLQSAGSNDLYGAKLQAGGK